jgi:hypothetical protein
VLILEFVQSGVFKFERSVGVLCEFLVSNH